MSDSYKIARELKESLRSAEYKKLEAIFSESEAFFLNHFCRNPEGGYGSVVISPNSLEFVRGVLKVMDYFLQLKSLDYYERSLLQKKRDSGRF